MLLVCITSMTLCKSVDDYISRLVSTFVWHSGYILKIFKNLWYAWITYLAPVIIFGIFFICLLISKDNECFFSDTFYKILVTNWGTKCSFWQIFILLCTVSRIIYLKSIFDKFYSYQTMSFQKKGFKPLLFHELWVFLAPLSQCMQLFSCDQQFKKWLGHQDRLSVLVLFLNLKYSCS